jgi:2-desacetyl-2-hydroxyethyl bacteriochlorophyllide A dehydrogenase
MRRKSIVFVAPGHVELQEEYLDEPGPSQVMVQTEVSAISPGTEMLFYRGQAPADLPIDHSIAVFGAEPLRYPLRYGYACVGRVIALGFNVAAHWLGQRVFAFQPHASHFCADPATLQCVPNHLTAETAVLLPNMETAVNLVMDGNPQLGENVAVIGQGVVGLLTTSILSRFPLGSLIAIDPLAPRLAAASVAGATTAVWYETDLPPTEIAACDLTFELSGNPAAIDKAIGLTRFSGRIVIGSWYGQKQAPINLGGAFHRSRIQILSSQVSTIDPRLSGRWDKARRFELAWRLLNSVDVKSMITHRFAVDKASTAYQMVDQRPAETLQVLLMYSETL